MRFQLLSTIPEPLVVYHVLLLLTCSSLIEHKLYFCTIRQTVYSARSTYGTRCRFDPFTDMPINALKSHWNISQLSRVIDLFDENLLNGMVRFFFYYYYSLYKSTIFQFRFNARMKIQSTSLRFSFFLPFNCRNPFFFLFVRHKCFVYLFLIKKLIVTVI